MMAKAMVAQDNAVELVNCGPISGAFKIELDGPGLYCLQGGKGTGKSTIMRGLQLLQGHKVDITIHDGQVAGHVSGFGVVAPLGPRKRQRGECVINTLSTDQFTFADFVFPQGRTAETRDKERIRALASLSGATVNPADYHELVGGKEAFDALKIPDGDDPVWYASRVKAAVEARARELEASAEREDGHAAGLEERAAGVELADVPDVDAALDTLDAARRMWRVLTDSQEAARKRAAEIEETKQKMALARAAYNGPTVGEAKRQHDAELASVREVERKIAAVEETRRELQEGKKMHEGSLQIAKAAWIAADNHYDTLCLWEETIAIPVDMPSDDMITQSKEAGERARREYDAAVLAADARKALQQAGKHRAIAKQDREEAARCRKAAEGTFRVLTESLRTERIRVEQVDGEARLIVQHPRRGKTYFDRENGLSEGERIMVAIEELLPRVDKPGLFDIPQEVFQGIQPADRKLVDEYARERGVYVFGAVVTDGELRVARGG